MALTLTRFLAQLHHISARCLRGDWHLGEVLFIVTEVHCQKHLKKTKTTGRAYFRSQKQTVHWRHQISFITLFSNIIGPFIVNYCVYWFSKQTQISFKGISQWDATEVILWIVLLEDCLFFKSGHTDSYIDPSFSPMVMCQNSLHLPILTHCTQLTQPNSHLEFTDILYHGKTREETYVEDWNLLQTKQNICTPITLSIAVSHTIQADLPLCN